MQTDNIIRIVEAVGGLVIVLICVAIEELS